MPKVKYGTEEYRNAYNKRSLANYDFNSKTYNLARPLPDIVATPKNNLDLGQVVRNGTSKIGKPIGVAITELAALHPAIGLSKALYAAGIKDMKKPIISGEVLLQPEKTVKTYKYFDGPVLPPLIMEEGYNYPRKIMVKPKNPNLYEDTIKEYQNKTARYSDNLSEL